MEAHSFLKTLVYRDDSGNRVLVALPGDRDVNEPKLRRLLGVANLKFEPMGAIAGFLGPVEFSAPKKFLDVSVAKGKPYVTGANKVDTHLKNVVYDRDFTVDRVVDVHDVREGDACPKC